MARAPLLQLSDVSLGFGATALFADLSLSVQEGDRLALVGRNGSGKSTLMKLMAGLVEPDSGVCTPGPGITVGYMEQDPDLSDYATLGAFAAAGLPEGEEWRIAREAEGLGFDPDMPTATASGGERRRAALARLLAQAPELMLLDEPTNHLDIAAIGWLERRLAASRTAFVVISHDRAFLNALARGLLWLDRGMVRRLDEGFSAFEDWRERIWAEEDSARHKLDRRIKAEGRWAVEGISARRKRNQGRLRALQAMRAERAAQVRRQGRAAMALEAGQTSGRLVIEAKGLSRAYGDTVIVKDLDLRLMRGDRLALVGPNGVGKTSLLRLLTGQEDPDAGTVRHGTALEMAVFDQNRATLDPDASLWDSLIGDPEMRVQGTHDQVMVRGTPRHVVGYLKDFLFDEAQARQPVRALSGGEKARLLLARIMARESNLLVLDEPTNDLDIETLDLLEDLIGDYAGTVLLVSHDRDFIDRVATQTLVMSGGGRIVVQAGGYSDWRAELGEFENNSTPSEVKSRSGKRESKTRPAPVRSGLSFTERNRLETLPAEIERIEAELAQLGAVLADPELYARDPKRFARATEAVTARQTALAAAEAEWLDLAERAEG